MPMSLRIRLSVMMFLQFFIWGSWYVTAPAYLTRVGFGPGDIGWMYSAGPIAAIVTPLFVGVIADRVFAVQRVLGVLHLVAGGIMLLAVQQMASGASPDTINGMLLGYMLCYFPTLALTNSLSMRNIENAERDFPAIRVLGTLGWIAAGLVLEPLGYEASAGMFYLAAFSSLLLGAYSFVGLPNTPPDAEGPTDIKKLLGLDALVLMKDRSFATFMIGSVLICIPLAFYYQMAARAVTAGGIENAAAKMTLGQASEVLFMLAMPVCFARLGVKKMLLIGMGAWVLRYLLFAFGVGEEVAWMLLGGIILHGICYDFFFVTGQIYTDKAAPSQIRSQAQGLLVLLTLGVGMLIGAQVASRIEAANTPPEAEALQKQLVAVTKQREDLAAALETANDPAGAAKLADLTIQVEELAQKQLEAIDWGAIWTFPAIAAAVVMLLFALLFRTGDDR